MPDYSQIFTLLFVMLGPVKMLGPFAKITQHADPVFIRNIAIRAIFYSIITLTVAAFLGEKIIIRVAVPVPILALSGGIILFLVALLGVIQQFEPGKPYEGPVGNPPPEVALYPLTFPTIVTPYGIAAVIVFNTLNPDLRNKLILGAIVVGIMVLNLLVMLFARPFFKPLAITLAILGAILGVLTVSLGAKIIYNNLSILLAK